MYCKNFLNTLIYTLLRRLKFFKRAEDIIQLNKLENRKLIELRTLKDQ